MNEYEVVPSDIIGINESRCQGCLFHREIPSYANVTTKRCSAKYVDGYHCYGDHNNLAFYQKYIFVLQHKVTGQVVSPEELVKWYREQSQ